MIKRVKVTKIGDVFEVKFSDTEKKYMQYIASDLTCLNSDVVRGFSKVYTINVSPMSLLIRKRRPLLIFMINYCC